MSLWLFRQVTRYSHPPSYLRAGGAATVLRFNSNSVENRKDQQPWVDLIPSRNGPPGIRQESIESAWKRMSEKFEDTLKQSPRHAYSGRSSRVQYGDVATAAKLIDRVVSQNNVARDWFVNRRHRQKGEERRRMKSVRWRRRFKQEVGKMVQLVQQIRRQGT